MSTINTWETVGFDAEMTEVLDIITPSTQPLAVILPFPAIDQIIEQAPLYRPSTPIGPPTRLAYARPARARLRPTWRAVLLAPIVAEAVTLWLMR